MPVVRVLLVVLALAGVNCRPAAPVAPPRPSQVPATAMWVGGVDGGVFLVFGKKASDPKQVYDVAIYHDGDGEAWFEGKLQLNAGEIAPGSYGDPKFFSAWDGERLHLADGRYLTAMPKDSASSR